jgi:hypothetical protein
VCRNIKMLFNFEPPATEDEIRAAAIQYVRKVSGTRRPSQANSAVFDEAIEQVTEATRLLVSRLTTTAPPRSRDAEAEKGRQRWENRQKRMRASAD